MPIEHFDVLIVGAGLSGIGAGYHLQTNCPEKTYAILEAREEIGGTWDLFRYPGIRADSDMYTLGYSFRPWKEAKAIADGESILRYVRKTARDCGIERNIRFNFRVTHAAWSSEAAKWEVTAVSGDGREAARLTCNFLFMCSGYYDYSAGYTPDFPGTEKFNGRVVYPQNWPDDIDYADKRVVVIGSGATAVTLAPELAKSAAHVVMLQRSPTYIVSRPAEDAIANRLRQILPQMIAYGFIRWKNVLLGIHFYNLCRKQPARVKQLILNAAKRELEPDFDVEAHFAPRYNPWDQRLCLTPDGDFFDAIRRGRVSVVTDHIDTLTENGLRLRSGRNLEADLIVAATGLRLRALGGIEIDVDGRRIDISKTMSYKGMMLEGVPNLAATFGYTNASWTLKCDLTCEYVCRLINHMTKRGYALCAPRNLDPTVEERPWIDFSSGYIQRSIDMFPKRGSKRPWKLHQNYALDILTLRYGPINDAAMEFLRPARHVASAPVESKLAN